jgi:hypothetical protein
MGPISFSRERNRGSARLTQFFWLMRNGLKRTSASPSVSAALRDCWSRLPGGVGHSALAERLGHNQRFASAGVLITTAVMGAVGYSLSYQAIFLASSALVLALLAALSRIHSSEIKFGRACGQPDHHAPPPEHHA